FLPAGRVRAGLDRIGLALAVLLAHFLADVERGDLRFRHRQRRLAAGCGDIELARNEHHEAAEMANAPGDATGLVAGAPIEIGARRSDDRRSRILRDHQALEGRGGLTALDRQIGFDEERRAVLVHPVDGNGAAWRQRHALRADGLALVREPGDAEEYIGAVGGPHLCAFVRMRGHPAADALRRDRVTRDVVALDEHALDRTVRIAVVRIEADAQRRAVFENHAPRAFELDREQVERIPEPADLESLPVERAGLDGAAVVVRHEVVVLVAAADARAPVPKWRGARLV